MTTRQAVIIGAGQAGVQAAESLRSGGFEGPVILIGDEAQGPYHRPPLSKAWLAGEIEAAQLVMRAPEALARKQITLRTDTVVQRIDRDARQVVLGDGERVPYTGLVLATGATARRLPMPHAKAPNVHVLRSLGDATALAAALRHCADRGAPLVVIGGGFIGLEVAATARKLGVAVTLVELQPRLLARVMPALLSDWFAAMHMAHGVALHVGVRIEGLDVDASGCVRAVRLNGGVSLPCGAVLTGVGAQANDTLAREPGSSATVASSSMRVGARPIPPSWRRATAVSAGCPTVRCFDWNQYRRASEGAKAAAAALLGLDKPFTATPWFWSDQYDRKLQMAGRAADATQSVLRGSLDAPSFSVWHYAGERLVGVDTIDAARDHLLARKLLDANTGPTPAQAADPVFDPASLLAPKTGTTGT